MTVVCDIPARHFVVTQERAVLVFIFGRIDHEIPQPLDEDRRLLDVLALLRLAHSPLQIFSASLAVVSLNQTVPFGKVSMYLK